MQCDMGRNRHVGDTETVTEVWTRSAAGDTITTQVDGETWTMPFNLSTSTVDLAGTVTEIDPTGEAGDIFTFTSVMTGTLNLNQPDQPNYYREIGTLSWNLARNGVRSFVYDSIARPQAGT